MKERELLLIFVKHPEAGKSKTRLAAGIGQENALAVYRELLEYTCSLARALSVDVQVWYGNQMPEQDLWSEAGFERLQQQGASLGERMEYAFQAGFDRNYERIAIIGSDCATVTQAHLEQAFSSLKVHDFVIGPATDGGYYLLGMKRMYRQVFRDKNWSTDTVLVDTITDLQSAKISHQLLETLSDVDNKEDLVGTFLEKYLKTAPH